MLVDARVPGPGSLVKVGGVAKLTRRREESKKSRMQSDKEEERGSRII